MTIPEPFVRKSMQNRANKKIKQLSQTSESFFFNGQQLYSTNEQGITRSENFGFDLICMLFKEAKIFRRINVLFLKTVDMMKTRSTQFGFNVFFFKTVYLSNIF